MHRVGEDSESTIYLREGKLWSNLGTNLQQANSICIFIVLIMAESFISSSQRCANENSTPSEETVPEHGRVSWTT